jgi:hypothetical protein
MRKCSPNLKEKEIMREEAGLAMRQEFMDAADAVEESTPPPATLRPKLPTDIMADFEVTETDLIAMASRGLPLKINGPEDRAGYAVAHATRIELRDARIRLDNIRKGKNDYHQAQIKTCNSVAKYLTGLITPAEEHLDAEEAAYKAEVERIKAEKQKAIDAKIQARVDAFQKVGAPISLAEIANMSDMQFDFALASATEAWEAKEKLRIAAEEALAKQEAERKAAEEKAAQERAAAEQAERERLANVKAEQEAAAKVLEEQRAALRKEQEEFEAKKRAAEQAAREEQIRKEEAEKAKAKAEQDAREAAERAERERAEAEARAKAIEAARPDAEKIRALAQVIREIALPKTVTVAGNAAMIEIENAVSKMAAFIEKRADAIAPITPKAP